MKPNLPDSALRRIAKKLKKKQVDKESEGSEDTLGDTENPNIFTQIEETSHPTGLL